MFYVTVERELKQLDDRLIKLLAYQRIQQLMASKSPTANVQNNNNNNNSKMKHVPLPSELLTPADIDRISRVFASPKRKSSR